MLLFRIVGVLVGARMRVVAVGAWLQLMKNGEVDLPSPSSAEEGGIQCCKFSWGPLLHNTLRVTRG